MSASARIGRAGGRALLALVMAVTTVLALGFVVNAVVVVAYTFDGAYGFEAPLVSWEPVEAPVHGTRGTSEALSATVLVSSFDPLVEARRLRAASIGLTSGLFVVACAVILVLCRRLWTGRPFTGFLAVSPAVLAVLALGVGFGAPWLRHRGDASALAELGYPTSGGEVWVEMSAFGLGDADGALVALGVVLGLVAVLFQVARRLQRDTEGLV